METQNTNRSPRPAQVGPEKVWTIKDILDWSSKFLEKSGSPSPRLDVEILLAEVLGVKRIDLYVNFDRPLSPEEKANFKELLKRRSDLEPIAYILGQKGFYGLDFKVNESTLIPRPDTEHLVSWASEYLKNVSSNEEKLNILDIGIGSGCVGITIANEHSLVDLTGWEVNDEAILVANQNAATHGVDDRSKFSNVDALSVSNWEEVATEKGRVYDLIVSNPPYICRTETPVMAPETKKYEPELALFAEQKGLSFYKVFAEQAKKILKQNAPIAVEIGYNQDEAVEKIFSDMGWGNIEVIKDFSDHPRVLVAFNS
jgi:release factor glutamine methyltransferase